MREHFFFGVEKKKKKRGFGVHYEISVDVRKLAQPEKRHGPSTRDLPTLKATTRTYSTYIARFP